MCTCTIAGSQDGQSGLHRLFEELCQVFLERHSEGLSGCHLPGVQVDSRGVREEL